MLKTLAAFFIFGSMTSFAQDQDSTSTNDLQEEIKIFKNYIPEISRVNKKNQQPLFLDSVYIKENLKYQVKKMVLKVDENNHPLSAVDYKKPFEKAFNSYVLLGYASKIRPLGEISLSNHPSDKWKYGFYFRHYSEDRKDESLFYHDRSDNKAMLYFDFIDKGMAFKSNVSYQRLVVNIDPSFIQNEKKEINHQIFTGDFSFEQNDSKQLIQGVHFNIKHGLNNYDASETQIDFGSKWNVPIGKHKISGNLDFITADHEAEIPSKDGRLSHFQFDPTFYGKEGKLSFQLGINSYYLIHEMGLSTTEILLGIDKADEEFMIFPKLYLSYALPEESSVYIGYQGDYSINTYIEAMYVSPFISPSKTILPIPSSTVTPVNIYAGLSTKSIHNLDLNVVVSYKEVERFQYFSTSLFGDQTDFRLYLQPNNLDLNIISIEANAKYTLNKQASIEAVMNFNSYNDVPVNTYLPHLPEFILTLIPEYEFNDKLKAFGEIKFISSHNSLLSVKKDEISSYADINLGASYEVTERLSTGLQVRNLLDNKVETYQGYLSNGFNVFVSARYKF